MIRGMTMALKSHQIAGHLTKAQEEWFYSQGGYARFTYNNALNVSNLLKNRPLAKALDVNAAINLRQLAVG